MTTARQVHLVRRPNGMPVPEDFAVVEAPLADAGEGEIQVQGLILSVDPYMRPRLDADQKLGEAMAGGGIGRVVQSRNARFREGDIVRHGQGFSERFNTDGRGVQVLNPDPDLPLSVYMHALGGTGITAYGGLLETGALKDGEQVFVSTAAGAVGSVAAQIARIKGCYVIGSTGSEDKKRWLLEEAGLNAAIHYRAENLRSALRYFENVGGKVFEAVLPLLNPFARIPVCGLIAQYNAFEEEKGGTAMSFLMRNVLTKRLTIRGFIVSDFASRYNDFVSDVSTWFAAGKIKHRETVAEGLANAPAAFIGMLRGENFGKQLVDLG